MPGFVKEDQERTGHYYIDLFLCNTNVYSETFITAQQSKNMLHPNCTRKSRTPVTAGEGFADKKSELNSQLKNMPLKTYEKINTVVLSLWFSRHWNWCDSQTLIFLCDAAVGISACCLTEEQNGQGLQPDKHGVTAL